MTAMARRGDMTIQHVVDLTGYSLAEIALVSRTVAIGAPIQELAVFLHACRQLGLDPLLKQAYWIRRKSGGEMRGTLQVGIDGFRGLADRQGNYAGSSEPVFRGYKQLGSLTVPIYAQVTTWKIVHGHRAAFTGEARWDEFYPGEALGAQWRKMPHHMLAKCAEAQSLRKGWPALLGSMAMDADMDAGVAVTELPLAAPEPQETRQQRRTRTMSAEEYDRVFYGVETSEDAPAKPTGGAVPEPDPEPETETTDDNAQQ